MQLFQDNTNNIGSIFRVPLYDAKGRPIYGVNRKGDAGGGAFPIYGVLGDYLRLRYDSGAVYFYGVADAEKRCAYTRRGQEVTKDTTSFEDDTASYGTVFTSSDLRIDSASGDKPTYATAKSRANTWLNELVAKANANEIDILQLLEAGKFSLRCGALTPASIYNVASIVSYGQSGTAMLNISESAYATVSTNSEGAVSSASAYADILDQRWAYAMLWCFPNCAPGCKLKITVRSYARVRCYYGESFRGEDIYPEFTPDSYIIKAYPVDAAWTNNLGPAIPIDRYNVQNIAVPFPYRFSNGTSSNNTIWDSEIELTVPPSRILVAVIDAGQFLSWATSTVRAFAGYDTTSTRSSTFRRERYIRIYLNCRNVSSAATYAKPVAP